LNNENYRNEMLKAYKKLSDIMGIQGASEKAAKEIYKALKKSVL
jgi:hypothetical protein